MKRKSKHRHKWIGLGKVAKDGSATMTTVCESCGEVYKPATSGHAPQRSDGGA